MTFSNPYLAQLSIDAPIEQEVLDRIAHRDRARDREAAALPDLLTSLEDRPGYRNWQHSPHGRAFNTWAEQAIEVILWARRRSDAWEAIWEHHGTGAVVPPSAIDTATPARIRNIAYAITALLVINAVLFFVLSPDGSASVGGVLSGAAAGVGLWVGGFHERMRKGRAREAAREVRRRAREHQRDSYGAAETPSWHPSLTLEDLEGRTRLLRRVIEEAPITTPVPEDLRDLAEYRRTQEPEAFPSALPSEARQLLELFAAEDAGRRGAA